MIISKPDDCDCLALLFTHEYTNAKKLHETSQNISQSQIHCSQFPTIYQLLAPNSKISLIFATQMRYKTPIKKVIVFSQWSRKSYAVFASLGKMIKIGQVSADISDRSLAKTTSLNRALNHILSLKKNIAELLEELRQSEGVPDPLIATLGLFLRSLVPFTSVQKEAKPARLVLYNSQNPCFSYHKAWIFLCINMGGSKS